jgi:hypothetical protein
MEVVHSVQILAKVFNAVSDLDLNGDVAVRKSLESNYALVCLSFEIVVHMNDSFRDSSRLSNKVLVSRVSSLMTVSCSLGASGQWFGRLSQTGAFWNSDRTPQLFE